MQPAHPAGAYTAGSAPAVSHEGLAAGDQREGRRRGLPGSGVGCLLAGLKGAVEHQHGVAMSGGHDGRDEPRGRGLVAAGQLSAASPRAGRLCTQLRGTFPRKRGTCLPRS
jgi:hypothetical protein